MGGQAAARGLDNKKHFLTWKRAHLSRIKGDGSRGISQRGGGSLGSRCRVVGSLGRRRR